MHRRGISNDRSWCCRPASSSLNEPANRLRMHPTMNSSASTTVPFVLFVLAVATASAAAAAGMMAAGGAAEAEHAANYLVYVEPHPPGVDCQAYQLGILAAALGSEAKAKAAILYNYKSVMSGFSARLTPPELEALKKQPQVNRVLPSATLSLMSSKFDGVS